MSSVRIATSVPRQYWKQAEKLDWLNKAIAQNPCDLFLTSQELFGGGSTREICRLKGIDTDDIPVTEEWLNANVGMLAAFHDTHIGIGASVRRGDVVTEDFLYYSNKGKLIGWHSKVALPAQDSVVTNGASGITPETDFARASKPITIPELGLHVGTVFCWQVFFVDLWTNYFRAGVNLVVHPVKFAPRAWYLKGTDLSGRLTRIGFTQEKSSDDPNSDPLGWIRKLKAESEFKQVPIAVTCNTWDAGAQYLAIVGWVDEVTFKTNLFHLPSTAETEKVVVTDYDPSLFDALPTFHRGLYGQFKGDFQHVMAKAMMRKAIRAEMRAQNGKTVSAVRTIENETTLSSFFDDI
jgi:hypothetical protein